MRYVSLFSGVEAASVAWSRLGWEPLAFAEVDEFPAAVLACRFPDVPNLGDVCGIDWEEFHERHGAVDVLIGGSPCQSFSIAGGRAGLQGESRLMFEYIRAVRDLVRASGGASPRYILWENVPGCLSSNKGRDFGCLLDELEDCGYFVAWRTLDSQFARVFDRASGRFAGPVPQRRRRVFLVGSLGGPSAADILFERSCLRGNHPKGREAREALAERVEGSPGMGDCAGFRYNQRPSSGSIGYDTVSPTIDADSHPNAVLTPWDVQSKRVYGTDDASPTLPSGTGEGMNIQPIVLQGDGSLSNGNQKGCGYSEDGSAYIVNGRDRQTVAFAQNTRDEVRLFGGDGQLVGALSAQPGMKQTSYVMTQFGEVAGTLRARANSSPNSDGGQNVVCFNAGNANDVAYIGDSQKEVAPSLRALRSGTNGTPVVCMESAQTRAAIEVNQSPTLNASHEQPIVCVADDNGKTAVEENMCGSLKVGEGVGSMTGEDVSYTLATGQDQTALQPIPIKDDTTPKVGEPGEAAYTLRSRENGGGSNDVCTIPGECGYVVRRLMPVETERLQAFPDNWTDITGCDVVAVTERVAQALKYERDSKEYKALRRKVQKWSDGTPDTPRYKAMGNSMTTLVIELLGRRIQAYDELHYDEVGLHG